jgi:hypothetical protein
LIPDLSWWRSQYCSSVLPPNWQVTGLKTLFFTIYLGRSLPPQDYFPPSSSSRTSTTSHYFNPKLQHSLTHSLTPTHTTHTNRLSQWARFSLLSSPAAPPPKPSWQSPQPLSNGVVTPLALSCPDLTSVAKSAAPSPVSSCKERQGFRPALNTPLFPSFTPCQRQRQPFRKRRAAFPINHSSYRDIRAYLSLQLLDE